MTLSFDPASGEVEIMDIRYTAGTMHCRSRLEGVISAVAVCPHLDPVAVFLNPDHTPAEANIDTRATRLVEKPFDEVAAELSKGPIIFVEYRHLCPGASGNVGEFEGDIAAADKHQRIGQLIELRKSSLVRR
jgi:hypothetical protein